MINQGKTADKGGKMAEIDPKNNGDNFDKEFSLNSQHKTSGTGKLPSWLMILVGAALIAAVVIVKKPTVQQISGTGASVNVQSGGSVNGGSTVSLSGDEKAGQQELEARFGAVSSADPVMTAASFLVAGDDKVYSIQLDELPVDDNGDVIASADSDPGPVYWVDEKPFAVLLEPADSAEASESVDETSSVYWIEDKAYQVHLDPVSSKEMKKLSEEEQAKVVQVGNAYYVLRMDPAEAEAGDAGNETAGPVSGNAPGTDGQKAVAPAPDDEPFGADENPDSDGAKSAGTAADEPAIVWLNEKPYIVTVKPYKDTSRFSEDASQSGKAVIPVTMVGDEKTGETKTAVFQADGKQYEISVTEIDPENALSAGNAQPVIWMDETPLRVELLSDKNNGADSYDISLEQLSEEDAAFLYAARFGKAYDSGTKSAEPEPESVNIEPEPETETTPEADEKGGNWFVNVFHDIFGGDPTATPTPQVTVIAVTPTAMPARPTATPILLHMGPTAEAQGPVRLDGTAESGTGKKAVNATAVPQSNSGNTGSGSKSAAATTEAPRITVHPTSTPQNRINVTMEAPTAASGQEKPGQQPTAVPTQEELPQTGLAESWNIPSMLAMLFGLLLVIIGVRRLRANR